MGEFAFQKEKKVEKPKNEEIEKMEQELASYYSKRRLFLLFSLLALVIGAGTFVGSVFAESSILYLLAGNLMAGGIVLLILRSALFNTRIRNRKEKIKYLEEHTSDK